MRSEGQSIRAIANATAISTNAVRRYLTSDEAPEWALPRMVQ
jgi:predicted transcriptional regulator